MVALDAMAADSAVVIPVVAECGRDSLLFYDSMYARLGKFSLAESRNFKAARSGEGMAAKFEAVGSLAAVCTTFCRVPQAAKIIREKKTEGISPITQSVFTFGIALWAAYGFLLNNRPILYANVVTLIFSAAIPILKIRYPSYYGIGQARLCLIGRNLRGVARVRTRLPSPIASAQVLGARYAVSRNDEQSRF